MATERIPFNNGNPRKGKDEGKKAHPFYRSARWLQLRQLVLKDQPVCRLCGHGKPPLHIDHLDGNRNNNDLCNLITLCPNCHSWKSTNIDRVSKLDRFVSSAQLRLALLPHYRFVSIKRPIYYTEHQHTQNGHCCELWSMLTQSKMMDTQIDAHIMKACHGHEGMRLSVLRLMYLYVRYSHFINSMSEGIQ